MDIKTYNDLEKVLHAVEVFQPHRNMERKLLRHIFKHKEESGIEHITFNWDIIEGGSRGSYLQMNINLLPDLTLRITPHQTSLIIIRNYSYSYITLTTSEHPIKKADIYIKLCHKFKIEYFPPIKNLVNKYINNQINQQELYNFMELYTLKQRQSNPSS